MGSELRGKVVCLVRDLVDDWHAQYEIEFCPAHCWRKKQPKAIAKRLKRIYGQSVCHMQNPGGEGGRRRG